MDGIYKRQYTMQVLAAGTATECLKQLLTWPPGIYL